MQVAGRQLWPETDKPRTVLIRIGGEDDMVSARFQGREVARQVGFGAFEQTLISTAVSELAQNILSISQAGTIVIEPILDGPRKGVRVRAVSAGSGDQAGRDGEQQRVRYAASVGLGLGLAGVQRLMDEFSVQSDPSTGTTVEVLKWL